MVKIDLSGLSAGRMLSDYRDSLARDLIDKFVVKNPIPGQEYIGHLVEINETQYMVPWKELPPKASPKLVRESKQCQSARWAYENAKRAVAYYEELSESLSEQHLRTLDCLIMSTITCGIAKGEYREIAASLAQKAASCTRGGKATALATAEEKNMIVQARDTLAEQREWPTIKAAKQIAAQLRTGTFPGIDRAIDYSDKYVANLRAER